MDEPKPTGLSNIITVGLCFVVATSMLIVMGCHDSKHRQTEARLKALEKRLDSIERPRIAAKNVEGHVEVKPPGREHDE